MSLVAWLYLHFLPNGDASLPSIFDHVHMY